MRQGIAFYTVALIVVLTMLGGAAAITAQQMLRRGANEPQWQMTQLYASKLAAGALPADVIPNGRIDIAESLEPFLIWYDDEGKPVSSNGLLDSVTPVPPSGVFDYARKHGSNTLTWQPRPGVRIAMVARHVAGPHPGFLVAGRSLRMVEQSENLLYKLVLIGWVAVVALLVWGGALLMRAARVQTAH